MGGGKKQTRNPFTLPRYTRRVLLLPGGSNLIIRWSCVQCLTSDENTSDAKHTPICVLPENTVNKNTMDWIHRLWPASRRKTIQLRAPQLLRRAHLDDLPASTVVGWKPHCEDARRRLLLFAWHEQGTFVQVFDRYKTMVSTVYFQASDLPLAVEDGSDSDLFNGTLLDVEAWPDGTYVTLDVLACCGFAVYGMDAAARRERFAAAYALHEPLLRQYNVFLRPIEWTSLRDCVLDDGTCARLHFLDGAAAYGAARPKEWASARTVDLEWTGGRWLCSSNDGRVPAPVEEALDEKKEGVYALAYAGRWAVHRHRPEKRHPDHVGAVEAVLATVAENVTLGELAKTITMA